MRVLRQRGHSLDELSTVLGEFADNMAEEGGGDQGAGAASEGPAAEDAQTGEGIGGSGTQFRQRVRYLAHALGGDKASAES